MEYLKVLQDQYLNALYTFRVFQALRKLRAPNIVGEEEADANARAMTRFKNFFGPTEDSLFRYSMLSLATVFDESDEALHVNAMLNYIGSNHKKITRDDFREFNQDRPYLDSLYERYEGMDTKDLLAVRGDLMKHETALSKLKDYRDQYLAHNDKKKDEIKITFDEAESLFALAEKTINLFSSKLNDSSTMYSHIADETMRDTKYLLKALDRSEKYRQRELLDDLNRRRKEHGLSPAPIPPSPKLPDDKQEKSEYTD